MGTRNMYRNLNRWLCVSDEVGAAMALGKPVVALESTLITHGLPRPTNFQVGIELENIVRSQGCTPATVALFNGRIHVGLSNDQLKRLSECEAVKVSRRDVAINLVRGFAGGTTVSGTMYAAHAAGIKVFATGGTGGVHRHVDQTWDISADLEELSRTPVAVVSAGVKSILDIPKTLEYLETQGVPVIVYGDNASFPGFFSRTANFSAPYSSDSTAEIARIIAVQEDINNKQGILIACPIPQTDAIPSKDIEGIIDAALKVARDNQIEGAKITPFLLDRLKLETQGKTLNANIALLRNNAKIAAQISVAYSKLKADEADHTKGKTNNETFTFGPSKTAQNDIVKKSDIVVIGASILDIYAHSRVHVPEDGCTHPGTIQVSCGGVARNHAHALSRLHLSTQLISAVGNDLNGSFVIEHSAPLSKHSWTRYDDHPTACYVGIVERGLVRYGIGDFHINQFITPNMVQNEEKSISESKLVIIDGNCSIKTIQTACDIAKNAKVPVWFEPTDSSTMRKIFDAKRWESIKYCSPNMTEFEKLINILDPDADHSILHMTVPDIVQLVNDVGPKLFNHLSMLIITMGHEGVVGMHNNQDGQQVSSVFSPDIPIDEIVSVSGAGDCFNAGVIYGIMNGVSWPEHLDLGRNCAHQCLHSRKTVPQSLHIHH